MVMLLFVGISAVATGLIAWFNWQLVGVTDEMKKATAKAAEAAEHAVSLDRPFLYTSQPDLMDRVHARSDKREIGAVVSFRNWGRNPAFIGEIRARLGIVNYLDKIKGKAQTFNFPERLTFTEDETLLPIQDRVIEAGQRSSNYVVPLHTQNISPNDDDIGYTVAMRILSGEVYDPAVDPFPNGIRIELRGVVHYRDPAQSPYWTEFHWEFGFPPDQKQTGFFLMSYRDSHQEAKK